MVGVGESVGKDDENNKNKLLTQLSEYVMVINVECNHRQLSSTLQRASKPLHSTSAPLFAFIKALDPFRWSPNLSGAFFMRIGLINKYDRSMDV